MRQTTWTLVLALGCLFISTSFTEAKSINKRQADQNSIDPTKQVAEIEDEQDREKRSQNHPVDAKWGVKNAVIGFVFNPKNTRFAWDKPTTTTTPKGPTTTEDIAIFEKGGKVELQIPDELFGSGFTLITNLSQTAGDLIINTALRTQRVLESMRPFLRAIFGAKGIVIEASTDKPIFSDPNSTSK